MAQAPSGNVSAASTLLAGEASNANSAFYDYIFIICASLIVFMAGWRIIIESTRYVRTLTCLNNPTQKFFAAPDQAYATFKKSFLYAPIFSKRHNREFQLSAAVNMGTLPTRFQLLFLLSYFATNVAFCIVSIHWDQGFTTYCKELRNRAGILSVVNMIPLFVMAGRNNPLISWLAISFDTFNLLHRWFGRIVALEAVVHTAAWIATVVKAAGWSAVVKEFTTDPMITFGLIVSLFGLVLETS